jgi:hypothetical protein
MGAGDNWKLGKLLADYYKLLRQQDLRSGQ